MGRGRVIGFFGLLLLTTPALGTAQGWVEPAGVDRGGYVVDKVRSEVRVRIDGRVARVEVSEWFRNVGGRVAEGHYLYPLPARPSSRASPSSRVTRSCAARSWARDQARAVYEDIVRRRADPALIELAGQGLLRAKLFPIEPGQERKVTLRFVQVLARAGDALQLQYAGAVKGTSLARPLEGRDGGPGRPGAPERRDARGAARSFFEVVAEHGDLFLDPFSPTHDVAVSRSDGRLSYASTRRSRVASPCSFRCPTRRWVSRWRRIVR